MFKIIALQTLPTPVGKYDQVPSVSEEKKFEVARKRARHDSVMKVLSEDEWFWLVKDYAYNGGKLIKRHDVLSDDFFSSKCPGISVSAIVGENGVGKSSLLELMFRLINNTSYAFREGLDVQKASLHFVSDIYARVWFHDDEIIRYIEQNDALIKIYNQNDDIIECEFDYNQPQKFVIEAQIAKNILKKLYYTIVVNYSQYAYNTNDYMAEWVEATGKEETADEVCWLNNLFHKNDAYQTPIVINPFREYGNIDINREKDLTQTRLYNLVLNNASPLKRILRKKEARAFVFEQEADLNPIPSKRYYSKKVVQQMSQMGLLNQSKFDYKSVNDIGRRITAAWGHALGYEIESRRDNDYWASMDNVRTINYIVYKTLKISRIYARYSKYHDCFGDTKRVREYVAALNEDTSHIMLKIRRCLAFLMFHHYSTAKIEDGKKIGGTMLVKDYDFAINKCLEEGNDRFEEMINNHYTKFYGKVLSPHVWVPDELMPAPSFKTDILLVGDDGDPVRFSSLSSGEKQMIYSISAVLYQLRNIDSVWVKPDQQSVAYKNVCLVFDEIELYAHPKYQLMLINLLIESIKSLGLFHVQNVQIILATHSPFVLSDIPSSNILAIADGKPIKEEQLINSFCANVYDILNNQFFLNTSIGDFAREKLNELIKDLNHYSESHNNEQLESLKKRIELVGDKYLRFKLLKALE